MSKILSKPSLRRGTVYVAGINQRLQTVTVTRYRKMALEFDSENEAEAFKRRHHGADFGFNQNHWDIEEYLNG